MPTPCDMLSSTPTSYCFVLPCSCFNTIIYVHIPPYREGSPTLTRFNSSAPSCHPLSHTPPSLAHWHGPIKTHGGGVCDAKRGPRYLPPSWLVEAFGSTTATSACATATKRRAATHPLHWASPASLHPACTAPPLPNAPSALITQITKHG